MMEYKVNRLLVGFHLCLLQSLVATQGCSIGLQTAPDGQCIDIDECSDTSLICGDNAQCFNTFGGYYCQCHRGYKSTAGTPNFTAVDGSCIDVNECIEFPGSCGPMARCHNTIGSHNCSCERGYVASSGEDFFQHNQKVTCQEVNECDVGKLVCGERGTCVKEKGGYQCICHAGSSNYGDGRARCVELNCVVYNPTGKDEQTLPGLESFLSLMRNSCQKISGSPGQMNGTLLLEQLGTAGDVLLSGKGLDDTGKIGTFLGSMENAVRLIGPQLRTNRTRKETNHTEMEAQLWRGKVPPRGPLSLSTKQTRLDTTWETAAGDPAVYPGFAICSLLSYKGLEISANNLARDMGHPDGVTFQINSRVVTVTVSNPSTSHLLTPINLTFTHLQAREEDYVCVYWDPASEEGGWSKLGCERAESNATHTVCSCDHLSSFAVLMALYDMKDTFQLQVITWVGLSLSLVCLFVCVLTFYFCRAIQSTRNTIHLHLCVSLFVADLVFLAGISSTENPGGCAFVAGLLHFFFLAAFCWMCLEGVQLYRMVVLVFNTTLRPLHMMAVGYGVPALIVAISAIANAQGYGTKRHCWLNLEKGFIWSFFGPVCVIIVVNAAFFVITVWKLAEKFSSISPDLSNLQKLRTFTITAIAQLCVLGTMWIFGCFQFEESTLAMSYIFTILNSLQGALIFLMHCLLSKQVREEYARFLSCNCKQKKKRYSEISTNQSSSSQPLKNSRTTGESQI